jgi:RNA polymerase sigma-70 factor (ECF subfamily)
VSPPRTQSTSDPLYELIPDVLAGNDDAITRFLRITAPAVLQVVRKVLGVHHPEVPDVVQEANFAVIEALRRYRGDCKVLHFVWRVAALTAMNFRRRCQMRERFSAELPDFDVLGSSEPSPYGLVVAAKRREAFRQLLDELPAPQAEALTMHCILGFTVDEAAVVSGVATNTMRGRLVVAKSLLRKKLSEDPELAELVLGVS